MTPALSPTRRSDIRKCAPHTPIQYLTGKAEFCGIDFAVDERVLIPRPETELLVEKVIELAMTCGRDMRILDLCTGSGNIAITLTKALTNCRIVASDISEDALAVARCNAEKNGASDRIEFVKSDLFKDVKGSFDIIASNPPYIAGPEFDSLQKEVLREPRIALDGGADGLCFYRNILRTSALYLKPAGHIVFEIGYGQLIGILQIIEQLGQFKMTEVIKDWRGIDRVVVMTWIN
jgi:release factor glutamine methyltransferase